MVKYTSIFSFFFSRKKNQPLVQILHRPSSTHTHSTHRYTHKHAHTHAHTGEIDNPPDVQFPTHPTTSATLTSPVPPRGSSASTFPHTPTTKRRKIGENSQHLPEKKEKFHNKTNKLWTIFHFFLFQISLRQFWRSFLPPPPP